MFALYLSVTGPLLRSGFGNPDINGIINTILVLLVAILVHELGHAIVADRLGDDTPRATGHMSLNPFRHMDQFGILLLFVTAISGQGFTYGFTPINERKLRERGDWAPAVVALAGPLMNLLLALITALLISHVIPVSDLMPGNQVGDFLAKMLYLNVFLAVFNLIPIPPLDGWSIVSSFLSPKARFDLRGIVQYGPFILLILFFFEPQIHFFSSFIDPIVNQVETALLNL